MCLLIIELPCVLDHIALAENGKKLHRIVNKKIDRFRRDRTKGLANILTIYLRT